MQFPQGEFPRGQFPYERYATFSPESSEPSKRSILTVYYPTGDETHARWVVQHVQQAQTLLADLLFTSASAIDVLLPTKEDWPLAPRAEEDLIHEPDVEPLLPYWTNVVTPSCLVVPPELDEMWGVEVPEKLAFLLYHEVALAALESDPRPWPDDAPLWADEWQVKFAALWLSHQIDGVQGLASKDMREDFEYVFEPEEDGKTPVTVRGFDWYDDTTEDEYLEYEMLLEQFAADLLARYPAEILPRFLLGYRQYRERWLSDEVTKLLASVLGEGGEEWLESLDYF